MKGLFVDDFPAIKIVISWNQKTLVPIMILDTGFNGDLQITPAMAQELKLEIAGQIKSKIASGQNIEFPMAYAISAFENLSEYVDVLISDNPPLVGMGFLKKFGCKAIIDCKNKNFTLKKGE
jgi:predicted aspartyl protease